MQAAYMGLYVRQMGGFNQEPAREIFGIPDEFIPVKVIAAGYKNDGKELPAILDKDSNVRNRKQIKEILFMGKFNYPVDIEYEKILNRGLL
jgi:nitroreductase